MKYCGRVHLIVFLFIVNAACGQKVVDAYVIGKHNDTIKGQIHFEKYRNLTFYKPFNLAMFTFSVTLVEKDNQEKEYFPTDIKGFNFTLGDSLYEYRTINFKNDDLQIFKSDDAPSAVFAQKLATYKERYGVYKVFLLGKDIRRYNARVSEGLGYFYAYFVETPAGIIKPHRTFRDGELHSILKNDLELEEEFIATIPKKARIVYLEEAIVLYNEWKKDKRKL